MYYSLAPEISDLACRFEKQILEIIGDYPEKIIGVAGRKKENKHGFKKDVNELRREFWLVQGVRKLRKKYIFCINTEELILRTEYKTKYLYSEHWKQTKTKFLELLETSACDICGAKDVNFHVHHLDYRSLGWEEYDDLRLLCADCHLAFHKLIDDKRKMRGAYHHYRKIAKENLMVEAFMKKHNRVVVRKHK